MWRGHAVLKKIILKELRCILQLTGCFETFSSTNILAVCEELNFPSTSLCLLFTLVSKYAIVAPSPLSYLQC